MSSQLKEMNSQPVHFSTSVLFYRRESPLLSPLLFSSLSFLCRQTVFLFWFGSLRQVEPLGSPQPPADVWVEGINPAWFEHSADASAWLPVLPHRRACCYREGRDDYLAITQVVKRLDNVSVQEQCGMNHRDDFDLRLCCKDEWVCVSLVCDSKGKLMTGLSRQRCILV